MHFTWRQTLAMIVAVGAIFGASRGVCSADPPLSRSPVVTMSDALPPFHEQESHNLNILTVTIDDQQKWLLKVKRVDTTDGTAPGVMLLSEIFPPVLRIVGLTTNMTLLEQPTERGTTITLQGFLYLAERNFYVRDVSVAEETAQEIQ
jgi:hypothetical protein